MARDDEPSAVMGDEEAVTAALGRAVHSARVARELPMRVVASRAEISQPFLSQIENGRTMPSLLTLYRLAKALGVSPAELIPGNVEPDPITVVRHDEGQRVAVSEASNAAMGRLVSSGSRRSSTVVEYVVKKSEDLGDWYESDGELLVYLVDGSIEVAIENRGAWDLEPGDAMSYPGAMRNHWTVRSETATILMVYSGDSLGGGHETTS